MFQFFIFSTVKDNVRVYDAMTISLVNDDTKTCSIHQP